MEKIHAMRETEYPVTVFPPFSHFLLVTPTRTQKIPHEG